MNYKILLKNITTFVFDFDGVLTDGKVYLLPPDQFVRTMNTRDSYAIQYAVKKGYRIVIITGGNNEMVRERMEYLGVKDVFMRASLKLPVFENFLNENSIAFENTLYMGDDLPDYHTIKKAGIGACPKDAAEEIKSVADYISPIEGGKGCVRDVIEQVLKSQGKWFDENSLEW
jgi:3-deoxy-D-manno-octulosonate 8-phosphate phosphatase (KDO 8-P phosphatase)